MVAWCLPGSVVVFATVFIQYRNLFAFKGWLILHHIGVSVFLELCVKSYEMMVDGRAVVLYLYVVIHQLRNTIELQLNYCFLWKGGFS